MESENLSRNWESCKEKIKASYPHVNDEDLACEPGKEEQALERIQAKLGKTKKEIKDWLHLMG